MSNLFINVIGGLIVVIIATWLGIGGSTKVIVQSNGRIKKTGKWIIIISVAMILSGLIWAGSNSPVQGGFDLNKTGTVHGLTLTGYGALLFFIGKIIS